MPRGAEKTTPLELHLPPPLIPPPPTPWCMWLGFWRGRSDSHEISLASPEGDGPLRLYPALSGTKRKWQKTEAAKERDAQFSMEDLQDFKF